MKTSYLFIIAISFSFITCRPSDSLSSKDLLNKCIKAHGGMEKWKSMTTTDYKKNIVLYNEDGSIEKEINQSHHYQNTSSLSGTIEWSDSLDRKIVYENGKAYKVNGSQKEAPSQSAHNSFKSAYYVLNMPWKLLDESAKVSYLGIDTILNNQNVHTLKVEYPNVEGGDVWEYYLDKEEYFLVANKVHHGSTYSLITNDEYTEYKGLKFNAKRTSYMVDTLGKLLYLRAKYIYDFSNLN